MSFTFIDYSATYFTAIAKQPIPAKRSGKFVQIINHPTNDEYLVLSPRELSVYHANIVERFCALNGAIQGSYNAKSDYFEIHDPDWEVIGGGMWELDEEEKTLSLAGASKMYGEFDGAGLKQKIQADATMSGYAVCIGNR
jgi:hypothetical protein